MMEETIKIEIEALDRISFALQQNQVPVIYKFVVENVSENSVENLSIKISFSPKFANEYNGSISEIQPGQKVDFTPLKIVLLPDYLFELSEKIVGNIHIEIMSEDKVIYDGYKELEVLPHDYWQGVLLMPEFLAAFIMPNLPKVVEITAKAGKHLQNWKGEPSFTGYQTDDINEVKMQVTAIYAALQEENIAYTMPPASFEKMGQRVRVPQEVLQNKQGTCIDLAVLFASCLEAININSLVIIIKGHAFVGYWLEEKTFPDATIDDCSAITKRIADGINEIGLVECTDFVAGKNITIDLAEKHARNHLSIDDDFLVAIDLQRTREAGIHPMPVRIQRDGQYEVIDYGKRKDNEVTSIPKTIDTTLRHVQIDEKEVTRQQLWERKLLDMSLRNTLLSFRLSKNVLQIMCADLAVLEDKLSDGKEFSVLPLPNEWTTSIRDSKMFEIENNKDMVQAIAEAEFKNNRIRTFLNEVDLLRAIKGLIRSSKNSLEENGTNTLYIALGFLKWFETEKSKKERYAPLIMIPVDIVKKAGNMGYVIRVRDDEPQINITLLEFLRQFYGITISGLDPLPQDDSGIDVPLILRTIRLGIMNQAGWNVEEVAYIGLFSFSRFVMWNDIRNRSTELAENKVVASLISGKMEWMGEEIVSSEKLDELFAPSDMAIPTSVDSSQLAAIVTAAKGQSFVLHGPPGTGKSQTITNMIANTLYQGKSVLFVAEKMAALSVVQKRLSEVGLAPFCLELHSNKSQKKNVLLQLELTLDVGHTKRPEEYTDTASKLHELRKSLNEVVIELHKKQMCGYSIFELVGLYEENIEYDGLIKIPEGNYSQVSKQKLQDWKDIISRLKIAYDDCGDEICNKFQVIKQRIYNPDYRLEIEKVMKDYIELISNTEEKMKNICSLLNIKENLNAKEYNFVYEFIKELSNCHWIFSKLILDDNYDILVERILKFIDTGKKKQEFEKQILEDFDKAILTFEAQTVLLQWNQSQIQWFLPKMLEQSKLIKTLQMYAKQPKQITKGTIKSKLEILVQYQEVSKQISMADGAITALFGMLWNPSEPEWQKLEGILEQTIVLRKRIIALPEDLFKCVKNWIQQQELDMSKNHNMLEAFTKSYELYSNIMELMKDKYLVSFDYEQMEGMWIQNSVNNCKFILEHLEYIKSWIAFMNIYDNANDAGIKYVADSLINKQVTGEILQDSFVTNISYAILTSVINQSNTLCTFHGSQFEETISKYKAVLSEFEILTIKELVAVLSEKIPNTSLANAGSSEIGLLQRAIKSGGRGMSVRKLFDSIPNLLRRLCPCMLMSPISVAQFIDPKFPKFDLVIFDEASQLPTSEAVGAIARGENVVVVGDPKQLPPTSFFSSTHLDEENIDKEDLESVLDDCLAINMPQQHLLWHYRSRHESLIAYSNMKYYENKLYTFPSPNDLISKVQYVSVNGFYDRSGTRQNDAEAQMIVKEIMRRLKDEELRKESIGVVTFSSVQQNLIDDLLVDEFTKNPDLEQINNEMSEPIFVKNLENVQGDERDVILFSICYAPDKEGKMSMNFGPINRDGGWRRLNVAISRARKEMIVYSTLKPENIDLSRTKSDGVAGLKGFLEYAMHGKNTLAVRSNTVREKNTKLAKAIAQKINDQGYQTNFEVGCSDYRVDIGVINPDDPSQYILGIMLDGDNYNMAHTSRDRNILQFNVLGGLGWNLYHIWTMDWLDSPGKELNKLLVAIKEAVMNKKEQKSLEPVIVKREIEFEKIAANIITNSKAINYEKCSLEYMGTSDDFYQISCRPKIMNAIRDTIEKEAPISHKLLAKRVLESWGIARSGSKVESIIMDAIRSMRVKKTVTSGQKFYWKEDQEPDAYLVFREPSEQEKRTMDDICEQEVANAIYQIMENQCSLSEEDLIREVGKLFGFLRMGVVIEKSVKAGIQCAISRGLIEKSVDGEKIQLRV